VRARLSLFMRLTDGKLGYPSWEPHTIPYIRSDATGKLFMAGGLRARPQALSMIFIRESMRIVAKLENVSDTA
jgi:hypothetical protein